MADTTTASGLDQLAQIYYREKAQDRLFQNLVFYNLGAKMQLPANAGQSYMVYRYGNIYGTTATIAENTLTAGQVQLTAQTATVTVQQYGQFITLSQFAQMSERSKDVLLDATNVLADGASDTVDLLIRANLATNATAFIGQDGSKTTASITSADTFAPSTLRRLSAKFRANKVRPFRDGQKYALVLHPFQSYDLLSDTSVGGFAATAQYSQPNKIWNGEIGALWGFRILESQNIVTTSVTTGVTAYMGFALGEDSFSCVALENDPIDIIVKGIGSGGTYDPYNNIATVAYKLKGFGVLWLGGMGENNVRGFKVTTAVSYNG